MKPLLLCIAILLLAAPVAQAAKFTGQTSQDRKALVRTDDTDTPAQFAFVWKAKCEDGGNIVHQTSFLQPFRESSMTRVRDGGPYTTHVRDDEGRRYEVRAKTRMRGRLVTDRKWRGRFRITMAVYRKDRFVTNCGTGRVTYTATR